MTIPDPANEVLTDFALSAKDMTKAGINAIRAAFGVTGGIAVILGVLLLVWPAKTVGVVAIFLGIYFIIAGIVRLAIGIFSRGITGGHRTLDIILGLLLVIAGVIALKNVATTAVALLILIVAVIGIGWIVEGVMALVESRKASSPGWAIAYGIISIIAGIIVLVIPGWSALWLIVFSAIALIVLGVLGVVRAFTFGRDALKAL